MFFSSGVLVCIAIAASCREPTQITLRITTGEKCSDLTGVQIVVGSDAEVTQKRFKERFSAAVTHACSRDGTTNLIGTLVVTPGTSTGTVVVSAGVSTPGVSGPDPADCLDEKFAKQCIIARRSFSFIDHTSLNLPIDLDPLCVGKACDPASTCFKGTCVDAAVDCKGSSCVLPVENGNGSGSDASSSDGAYDAEVVDGAGLDGGNANDGSGDTGSTVMDSSSTIDAKGVPTCLFVVQGMSMVTKCDGSLGDVTGMDDCMGGTPPMNACCHCTCGQGINVGNVVSCEIGSVIGSSCHPIACMP